MTTLIKTASRNLALAGALAFSLPAALALPGPAEAQATRSDAAKFDRAVRALRSLTTLKADFVQTNRSGQALSGQLTLKNPGKIRFQYAAGVNMLIVSDGRALSVVDYDVQQVERWPIRSSPLGALLDPNRDMSRYGRLLASNDPGTISIAVADPDRPEIPQITMIFVERAGAPGGLQLHSWVAIDAQNVRTTVRLSNHRYGVPVANSAFTFRDPRRSTRRPN